MEAISLKPIPQGANDPVTVVLNDEICLAGYLAVTAVNNSWTLEHKPKLYPARKNTNRILAWRRRTRPYSGGGGEMKQVKKPTTPAYATYSHNIFLEIDVQATA